MSRNLEFVIGAIPKLKRAGRKAVNRSPYSKKDLSCDARVIWALLKKQPRGRDELCKSAGISRATFYSVRPLLESLGILKGTEIGYTLSFYDEAEEVVIQTVRLWRKIAFRDPLPEELADETGMSPEKAEELARKTRDRTGWFMPNEAILDNATEKLGEVLGYLARKKEGMLSDFDYEKYPEIVKEAELGLKEHLKMLPTLDESGDVISWPPNALKYLRKNYKLKDLTRRGVFVFGPTRNPWRPQ